MGTTASKPAARAAGSAVRKYPSRTAAPAQTMNKAPVQQQKPRVQTAPPPRTDGAGALSASQSKTDATLTSTRDPALLARLSQLGAVQPNPHYSPTSTSAFDPRPNPSSSRSSQSNPSSSRPNISDIPDASSFPPSAFPSPHNNPALLVLAARARIASDADAEMQDIGRKGFKGRSWVEAGTLQLALMRLGRGEPAGRVEEGLGIRKGRLGLLGKGLVGAVQ